MKEKHGKKVPDLNQYEMELLEQDTKALELKARKLKASKDIEKLEKAPKDTLNSQKTLNKGIGAIVLGFLIMFIFSIIFLFVFLHWVQ